MKIEKSDDKYKEILEEVRGELLLDGDMEALKDELFTREDNFNNADPTSHQHCWLEHELSDAVDSAIEELGSNFNSPEDIIF